MGVIYLAYNLKNDKKYVGFTSKTMEQRRKEHEDDARRTGGHSYFQRAIAKHGSDVFEWKVLEKNVNDNWQDRERWWIKFLESKTPNGYNLTDGGDGVVGRKHSPETCAKLSALKKGKPNFKLIGNKNNPGGPNPRSSEFMKNWWKNPKNYTLQSIAHTGKVQSAETVAKRRKAMKGKPFTGDREQARLRTLGNQNAKGCKRSAETKKLLSQASRRRSEKSGYRDHQSKTTKNKWGDPAYRENHINVVRAWWAKRKADKVLVS